MGKTFFYRLLYLVIFMGPLAVEATQKGIVDFSNWLEFKSDQGQFSVRFPSEPTRRITHQASIIGRVTNHTFESKTQLSRFAVDYSDLPGLALAFTTDETIYRMTAGALLKRTLGKLLSEKDLVYQGHRGRHLIYYLPSIPNRPSMYGEAYLLLVEKRLYVINAIAPAEKSTALTQHFLQSLRID